MIAVILVLYILGGVLLFINVDDGLHKTETRTNLAMCTIWPILVMVLLAIIIKEGIAIKITNYKSKKQQL